MICNVFYEILNETVTIELKNGLILHGIMLNADKYMNIYLKKIKKTNFSKINLEIESISIRGSSIKYLILPIWINFDSVFFLQKKSLDI
ncbi:small nuclear ribonucleoprotein D1 (nucleomorph) [Cryptomonas paramecium]|uniref:Small nuclear ribonucleoprotein D1 n=1 Tax=Cryptomonas paramaecium TaxID=2898 RepID=F2HHE1_9CRYP|nr:small nuclear ribonucleoprotein D1 [Cryptomonas paramecium]AEA38737.1 small nuclear ribonucleoprotein D1 [Cryptomonas paramecium]|mmetsp:Transcript_39312/g.104193  ORF Transcript_39312/g.104193 Transcript_39312/m.104193 type:complete len:89 (-) Transcript_39312:55-321(-)